MEVAKTVEDYLNEVDYRDDSKYVPTRFALQFVNFIKLVNGGEGEEHKTPVVHYKMLDKIVNGNEDTLNMIFRGAAKALDVNTLLITPTGYVRMGDIEVGDIVIDRNGLPTKVTHVSEIFDNQAYEVKLTDGSSFIANEDHLHIVQRRTTTTKENNGKKNYWKEEVLTTKELLEKKVTSNRTVTDKNPKGRELKWYIPLVNHIVQFDSVGCALDPYTVGVILGDGSVDKTTGMPSISSHIDDVYELKEYIPYSTSDIYHDKRRHETTSFRVHNIGLLVKSVIGTNTTWTKSIPNELLFGTPEERIEVLRGLLDTDGTISDKGNVSFTSSSKELANGVVHIVKSLGGYARISKHTNDYAGYYNVSVNLLEINPFKLKRKADKWLPNKHYKSGKRVGIESIEPVNGIESKCISVDSPSKSYLIEDCIVTHNTTLFGEYFFLYLATYGELPNFGSIDLAIYVSDSIENGVKNMRNNLEFRWNESEFLQQYVPKAKFTDVRWEFVNASGKKVIIKAYGGKTGVRGTKEMGKRPQLAVLDDLVSDDDARSPTIIATIEDTVYKAIEHALHPVNRKVIWNGTPFNANDPLYKAAESGAWSVNAFPVCNEFPCKKEEFAGAWEDRFGYEQVLKRYEKAKQTGKLDGFNQELMLRIISDEDRMVLDEDIVWYNSNKVRSNKGAFNFYITTDFATSENKNSDYSVISVWAYNNNGDWLLVDGVCERQLMNKNIDDLFRLVTMYHPQQVGIEVSGQQGGFISWIYDEMMNRNIYFTLASENNKGKAGLRPNTNKMERFNTVLPLFKTNKIWLPEDKKEMKIMVELLEELKYASPKGFKSKHDDVIDTVSMLGSLTPWKPSEVTVNDETGLWEDDEEDNFNNSINSYIV